MNKIIIIGAGPAGLSAAITLCEHGEEVVVLDEYLQPGGRLLGQLYQKPSGEWWNGIKESANLYQRALRFGAEIHLNESVVDIEREGDCWIIYTDQREYSAEQVILATGAAEKPFTIPGWTLPGVMSVGAAQVMTNVHRVKPGKKGIIIGVNVLSSAIAMELQLADIDVQCIALPVKSKTAITTGDPYAVMNSLLHVSHMAPSKLIQWGSMLMKSSIMKKIGIQLYPSGGMKMWNIPIMLKKAVIEIYGDEIVQGVTLATVNSQGEIIPGTEEQLEVDFVCIAGGLYPLAELAALCGCPFYHIPELGGHVPLHSEKMETSIKGLYVAGNITGIEGANIAMAQGIVAAYSVLQQRQQECFSKELNIAMEQVREVREAAFIQFHPEVKRGKEQMQYYWENNLRAWDKMQV